MNGRSEHRSEDIEGKREYIREVRSAIEYLYQSVAVWVKTVHVKEVHRGKTMWDGDVEVFSLIAHPKARHAYGWAHMDGTDDSKTRYVAVLEVPPVDSAETAVRAAILAYGKKN